MITADHETLVELEVSPGVSVKEIDEALNEIWRTLTTPSSREATAKRFGIELPPLDDEQPFSAEAGESEFGVLTSVIVTIATYVGLRLSDKLIDKLFDLVIWPEIERRFGDKVKRKAS